MLYVLQSIGDRFEFLPLCSLTMSQDRFRNLSRGSGVFTEQSMEFQEKIMERSGLGDNTYLPMGNMPVHATYPLPSPSI